MFASKRTVCSLKTKIKEFWLKNKSYIYAIEHDLAIEKNEILPFVTAWMDLECIMPCEISHN